MKSLKALACLAAVVLQVACATQAKAEFTQTFGYDSVTHQICVMGLSTTPITCQYQVGGLTITGGATAANQALEIGYLTTIAAAVTGTGPTTTGNLGASVQSTGTSMTPLITGTSGKITYLTSLDITSSALADVSIYYSTVGSCASSTTLLALYHFVAGGGLAKGNGTGNILPPTASGANVCYQASATSNVSVNETHVQQ